MGIRWDLQVASIPLSYREMGIIVAKAADLGKDEHMKAGKDTALARLPQLLQGRRWPRVAMFTGNRTLPRPPRRCVLMVVGLLERHGSRKTIQR